MKYKTERKLVINFTLNSSEAIMFEEGGKHETILDIDEFEGVDQVKITFQLDEKRQHDFIKKEAMNHLNSLSPEDKSARERDGLEFLKVRLI